MQPAVGGYPCAGHMQEDGAAAALAARPPVVVENDDQVIKSIAPPKLLGAGRVGMPDRAIVVAVAHRVAPTIVGTQGARGQARARPGQPVRAIEDLAHAPAADRGGAVAFAFADATAAAPERTSNDHVAPTAGALAWHAAERASTRIVAGFGIGFAPFNCKPEGLPISRTIYVSPCNLVLEYSLSPYPRTP